jgi:predicted DNA-binding protein
MKEATLRVRLPLEEIERLRSFATSKGWTMSQVIRDYIRRLPRADRADTGRSAEKG